MPDIKDRSVAAGPASWIRQLAQRQQAFLPPARQRSLKKHIRGCHRRAWLEPILTQAAPQAEARIWRGQNGLNSKIYLAVDAHGMPVRVLVTSGTDRWSYTGLQTCWKYRHGLSYADKGCDCDAVIEAARESGMTVVNLSRSNRKSLREYDKYLHMDRARHLVENAFLNKNVGAA